MFLKGYFYFIKVGKYSKYYIHTIFFFIFFFFQCGTIFLFRFGILIVADWAIDFSRKIINLIDLYLHLKVICKFECPVRDTIESTEVSLNSTLYQKKLTACKLSTYITCHCFITILTLFCYFHSIRLAINMCPVRDNIFFNINHLNKLGEKHKK